MALSPLCSVGRTKRQTASARELLLAAIGGSDAWAGKLSRVARTLAIDLDRAEVRQRLRRLRRRGHMAQIPSAGQLLIGGLDQLRFFIAPGANDYSKSRGIDFTFHQLLRATPSSAM